MCRCSIEDLDAEKKIIEKRYGSPKPVHYVKQTEPDELLVLNRLFGGTKAALKGFLKRFGMNNWMQGQRYYVQKAALAAAHMRTAVWRRDGHWCSHGCLGSTATTS